MIIFGENRRPSISSYPDSDKLGLRPGGEFEPLNFRRGDAVDYWDGEHALDPGDLVAFPPGPAGAREVSNPGPEPTRLLLMSTAHKAALRHFPEAGTLRVTPPGTLWRGVG